MKKVWSIFKNRKYGGRLIFSEEDNEGVVEIIERKNIRAMHFGSAAQQSALDLKNPDSLVLHSPKALLQSLLFLKKTEKILLFGLGGGSIVRFIHKYYPEKCTYYHPVETDYSHTPRCEFFGDLSGSCYLDKYDF